LVLHKSRSPNIFRALLVFPRVLTGPNKIQETQFYAFLVKTGGRRQINGSRRAILCISRRMMTGSTSTTGAIWAMRTTIILPACCFWVALNIILRSPVLRGFYVKIYLRERCQPPIILPILIIISSSAK